MKIFNYAREKQFVFFLLIPLHACLFILFPALIQNFSIIDFLTVYFFWFLFGGIGIEVGYHRYFSHSAFKASTYLENCLAIAGIWGAQWSPLWWKSLHTLHHKETDRRKDPHSPQKGFFYSLIGWYLIFNPRKIPLSYGKSLMKSPIHNFIHKHYLALFWSPIILMLWLNTKYALIIFVLPAVLSFWQENLINSVCHVRAIPFNYRNFSPKDQSRNNLILGYFIWGAGFHNNHHQDPSAYSFAKKSFEFDICYPTVRALLFFDKLLGRH